MKILLYSTSSANNVINKVLTNEKEYEIKLKDNTDTNTPVIRLNSADYITANYAYIDRFKKYYFIERIELYPNRIYEMFLRCDVLETYKEELLQCEGFISQQQNINPYYDSGFKSETRKEVDIYKSDVSLTGETSTILVTIGG